MTSWRHLPMILLVACTAGAGAGYLLAKLNTSAPPGELYGRVIAVHAGDAFTLKTRDDHSYYVRIHGISAPRGNRQEMTVSRESLSGIIAGYNVSVRVKKAHLNRVEGAVFLGSTDAAERQVMRKKGTVDRSAPDYLRRAEAIMARHYSAP